MALRGEATSVVGVLLRLRSLVQCPTPVAGNEVGQRFDTADNGLLYGTTGRTRDAGFTDWRDGSRQPITYYGGWDDYASLEGNTICQGGATIRNVRCRPALVATVLAASALAMLTPVAVATNHYHSTNGSNHGFVHGGSTTDGSMHSRVEFASFRNYYRECWVFERASAKTYEYRSGYDATTCNLWNGGFGADPPECKWNAYLRYDYTFAGHFHYAQGYNGYC